MSGWWRRLSPKQRRLGFLCAVPLAFVTLINLSLRTTPERHTGLPAKSETVRHLLTSRGPHKTGMDAISAELKDLRDQHEKLFAQMQKNILEQSAKKSSEETEIVSKVLMLEKAIAANAKRQVSVENFQEMHQQNLAAGVQAHQPKRIQTISIVEKSKKPNPKPPNKIVNLPAGTILSGVLLNGLDAHTGAAARRGEQIPALVRLQLDGLLPNAWKTDIRECVVLLAGHGDNSSERAYLRAETISCVCEDGSSIEKQLDGYAVGEDGKVGLRGRVVSKQGLLIGNSLLAGFLGGASKAFDVSAIPAINLGGGGKTAFQHSLSSDALQGAAAKGASSALDRVAKFYLEQAETLFPVIEIDAGRQVDIVVKKGNAF